MKIIDLTHTINEDISVYPGTPSPTLKEVGDHDLDGYRITLLTMTSHTGTHVDSPYHIYKSGKTLNEFDVSSFIGKAMIVDIRNLKPDEEITPAHIDLDIFNKAHFILFYRGVDKHMGTDAFLDDYPVLSKELIDLINNQKKKGLGFDVIGLDKITNGLELHNHLFTNDNIINFENLNNLGVIYEEIGSNLFTFIALPLKFKNCDGAPVRAIALL